MSSELSASDSAERRRVDVTRILLVAEGLVLLVLTVFGGFGLFAVNRPHAVVLVVTGVLALLVTVKRRLVVPFAVLQLIGYLAFYVSGTSTRNRPEPDFWALNDADRWLHLGIVVYAVVIIMIVWAGGRRVLTRRPPY